MNLDWKLPTLNIPPSNNLESRILISALKEPKTTKSRLAYPKSHLIRWGIAASTFLAVSLLSWNQYEQYKKQQEVQLSLELFSHSPSFQLIPEISSFSNVDLIVTNISDAGSIR